MSKKLGIFAAIAVLSVFLMAVSYNSVFDYNETGQRTFAQTYMGDTNVIYEAGPFYYGNGRTTKVYNALRTTKTPETRACDYEQNDGFIVQYGDGGKGSICAQLDANLSMDESIFKALIAKFRNEEGIRTKLLEPNYRALFTTTAELFTSTEAYETKRSQIAAALQDQLINGAYITQIEEREIIVGVDDNGKNITQRKDFSIIALDEHGAPMYAHNVFADWDMADINVTITGYDFEPKTITQINNRRDATNRGETAQAEAKAAYWEGKKAEAEGEKNRVVSQAKAEVANAPQIANAKRDAVLAKIEATKIKEKATEMKLAAIETTAQKKEERKAAVEEAAIIVTLADANAYKIDKEQQAGELFKRIEADILKNRDMSKAIENMQVPTTMIVGGASASDGSNEMQQLLQLQVLKQLAPAQGK